MMLFSVTAVAKLGCGSAVLLVHVPASERPVTVNRSSTPPLGSLVLTEPLLLKKNGKRASRVGPVAVIKDGVVFRGATPLFTNWACGLLAAPLPPKAGCAWQELQLFELNRGPKPLLPAALPETDSTAWKRFWPSVKKASSAELLLTEESTAPVPRLPLCTPGSL